MANAWTELDSTQGVWLHEYTIPIGVKANCLAVRIGPRQLMVVSPAHPASEAVFSELDQHGEVVALVAPNVGHDLGQPSWQARYPNARCFAPSVAIARLQKGKPQLRAFEPIEALRALLPADVQVHEPPGMRAGALHVLVKHGAGVLYYFDDMIGNQLELQGPLPFRLLFKWTNSAPGFKLNRLFRLVFVSDKPAARAFVLELLGKNDVTLFVPAHGAPIERPGLSSELRELVQAL